MAPATTSPTASLATEAARRAVIASAKKTGIVTATAVATESDVTVIAAVTGIAAVAAPQTLRGHLAVMPAAIGAVGAAVRAGTATIGHRAATETETTIAADGMGDRAPGHRADVFIALETAMIGGIIGNAESDGMTTETAVAAGRLARIRMPATLLRRNSPRTRGIAGPSSSSSLPRGCGRRSSRSSLKRLAPYLKLRS